ncbi:MAG: hypothetical protein ACE5NC_03270 [Anaerolineae bacterium]
MSPRLILTPRRLFVLLLFLAIFAMATQEIADPDFWWHLRTGQLIWDTGSIPRTDPFSHTMTGAPWVAHEWLSEALLYAGFALGGDSALILIFAGIITITFWLVYAQSEGRPYLAGFLTLAAALASAISWGVRPQMITLLFGALFLFLLEEYRSGRRHRLWLLPLLTAIWVNLHGGYLLGPVLIAAYLAGAAVSAWMGRSAPAMRPLALTLLASGAASLLNPQGPGIWLYPFGTLASAAMQSYIVEWFSPDFHQAQFLPLAALFLLTVITLAVSRRPLDPTDTLLLLGLGFAGLRSARNVPLFALVAAPILSRHAVEAIARSQRGSRWIRSYQGAGSRAGTLLNVALLGLALFAAGLKVGTSLRNNHALQTEAFPAAAVEFIQANPPEGKMFNLYRWGGYLTWRLWPQHSVYIDGRADLYGDAFIETYLQTYRVRPGWDEPLHRFGVEWIVIDAGSPLATLLDEHSDWARAYRDALAEIFVRPGGR